jgi:hypothetical protein
VRWADHLRITTRELDPRSGWRAVGSTIYAD